MSKINNMTEKQINQVALDLFNGKIFTDRHLTEHDDVAMVFMPLVFGGLDEETRKEIGLIYQNMDQAGPMSVNGKPTFFSMRFANKEDTKKIFTKCKAIDKAVGKVTKKGDDKQKEGDDTQLSLWEKEK